MVNVDDSLAWRIRDIVAVVSKDIDSVRFEVEDGVAYIEGVVSSGEEARAITKAVSKLRGLTHVVSCLSTEKVMPSQGPEIVAEAFPAPVVMHFYSLS